MMPSHMPQGNSSSKSSTSSPLTAGETSDGRGLAPVADVHRPHESDLAKPWDPIDDDRLLNRSTPIDHWPLWAQYVFAIGVMVVAVAVRFPLMPLLGDRVPFITLFMAMLLLLVLVRPGPFLAAAAAGLLGLVLVLPLHFFGGTEFQVAEIAMFVLAAGGATGAAFLALQLHHRKDAKRRLLSRDARAMRLLVDVGHYCARTVRDRRQYCEAFLATAIELSNADMGCFQVLNDAGQLEIESSRGFERPFLEYFRKVDAADATACGEAMRSRRPIVVTDITQSEIYAGHRSLTMLLEAGVRSVISVPLLGSNGVLLGVMSMHFDRPHDVDPRTLQFLELLARAAGDSLQRLRTEALLQAHGERLELALDERTEELTSVYEQLRGAESRLLLSSLAEGIAHDLGNLLMPMQIHLRSLQRDLPEVKPADAQSASRPVPANCNEPAALVETHREDIEAIADGVRYIGDLAARLRQTMVQIDSGKAASGAASPVLLAGWVRLVQRFLRSFVPSPLKFSCDRADNLPTLCVNEIALTQAVYNLVQNAVKAIRVSGVGGAITLSIARIDGAIEVKVTDDGPGMPADLIRQCTERGYTTRPGESSGLGLCMVKEFVESAGGKLIIQSPLNQAGDHGTSICMKFPIKAGSTCEPRNDVAAPISATTT